MFLFDGTERQMTSEAGFFYPILGWPNINDISTTFFPLPLLAVGGFPGWVRQSRWCWWSSNAEAPCAATPGNGAPSYLLYWKPGGKEPVIAGRFQRVCYGLTTKQKHNYGWSFFLISSLLSSPGILDWVMEKHEKSIASFEERFLLFLTES